MAKNAHDPPADVMPPSVLAAYFSLSSMMPSGMGSSVARRSRKKREGPSPSGWRSALTAAEAYGVENPEAYARNREAYRQVYENRKLTESFLDAFYRQWQKAADRVLQKPLRELLDRETAFELSRTQLR